MKVIPKMAIAQVKKLKEQVKEANKKFEAIKITSKTKEQVLTDMPLIHQELVLEEGILYIVEDSEKHFDTERGNRVDQTSHTKAELKEGDYLVKTSAAYQLNNFEMEEVK